MRGKLVERLTNFSGGVRAVDATLAPGTGAGKWGSTTQTAPPVATGRKGAPVELLSAKDMMYDRRTGSLRRRDGHTSQATFTVVANSIIPGAGFPAGTSRQLIIGDGANVYKFSPGGSVSAAIIAGLTAGTLLDGVMAPQSPGGQGPMWLMNGSEARYWTGAVAGTWTTTLGTLPIGKYLEFHNLRVWIAGVTTYAGLSDPKSALFWTDQGNPQSIPAANVTMFDPNDGDELTGIGRIGPYLLVFKRRKTWLVYDLDTSANRQLSAGIGCISHRSIVETAHGTYFMSDRGLCVCDGSNIKVIDDKLNLIPQINLADTQINLTRQINATGLNDEYYLNVGQRDPPPGVVHPEIDLSYYDLLNDAWWPFSRPMMAMCVWDGYGQPEVWGLDVNGASSNNPVAGQTFNLVQMFSRKGSDQTDVYVDGTTSVNFRLRDVDFGTSRKKRLRSIVIEANAQFQTPQYRVDSALYWNPLGATTDLTSATGMKTALLPRIAGTPPGSRLGLQLYNDNLVATVNPSPFEFSSITLYADLTER